MFRSSWLERLQQVRTNTTRRQPYRRRTDRRTQLLLEVLEDRTVPSTILWSNRGSAANDSDGFNAVFGANADTARNDVAAALLAWQNVIASFNYSNAGLNDTLTVTVNMDPTKKTNGASASPGGNDNGKPTSGAIKLGVGSDGKGAGWFLDPTPGDSKEFEGNIINPYAGLATAGGPAAGLADLFTVTVLETTHIVGLNTAGNETFQQDPGGFVTDTNQKDAFPNNGGGTSGADLFTFNGPDVKALYTGGDGGNNDGTYIHVANAIAANTFTSGGTTYFGADDSDNEFFFLGERLLPSNLDALCLQDVYGYTINSPSANSFYAVIDPGTKTLLIRGGSEGNDIYSSQNNPSNDKITLKRVLIGGNPFYQVSVTIGNPTPGTGPNPTYVSTFAVSSVNSINIQGGGGNETITLDFSGGDIDPAGGISVNGGSGTSVLNVNDNANFTLTDSTVAVSNSAGATMNYSNIATVNLTGGASNNTFDLSGFTGFSSVANIDGQGGNDKLLGPNLGDTWNITGANSGNADFGSITFVNIQNLTGGTSSDDFIFGAAGSVAGNIDGGAGADTIDFSALGAQSVTLTSIGATDGFNGFTPGATPIGGTFFNINGLIGSSAGSDTLTGTINAAVWTLTGANRGTYLSGNSLSFSSFENLNGGSGNDNFVFNAAGSISGNLNGGAGSDTLNNSAIAAAQIIVSGAGTLDGVQGTATGIGGNFNNINSLATKLLIGPNGANIWTITGANSGTLDIGAVTVPFTAPNLTGGTSTDDFIFAAGGSLTGSINGGGGNDTIDFTAKSPQTVNLTGLGAPGFNGIISSILGGTFASISNIFAVNASTLVGINADATWNITGNNAGNYVSTNTLFFTGVGNLAGGSGNDTFTFSDGKGVTGLVNGGGGTHNTLDYHLYTTSVSVNIQTGACTGTLLAGGINNVIGGSAFDTLIGANFNANWNITSNNGGTYTDLPPFGGSLTFTSFENLIGGTANDTFIFSDGVKVSGVINGGLGSDTIDWSAYTTDLHVTLTAFGTQDGFQGTEPSSIGSHFDNIDCLVGGSGANNTIADGLNPPGTFTFGDPNFYTNGGRTLCFTDFLTFLPANNVNLFQFGNTLTINGDNLANNIILDQPAAGEVRVRRGAIGTTFTLNGVSGLIGPEFFFNVANININMGNGNDVVRIDDRKTSFNLSGGLTISGGTGNDQFFSTAKTGFGLFVGGNFSVNTNIGSDAMTWTNISVNGNATLVHQSGNDSVTFGVTAPTVYDFVGGGLTINNGAGFDNTTLTNTNVGGNVAIGAGGMVDSPQNGGNVLIQTLAGAPARATLGNSTSNQVTINNQNGVAHTTITDVNIRGGLNIGYKNTTNAVTTIGGTANFAGAMTIGGAVYISGNGADSVTLGSAAAPLNIGGALNVAANGTSANTVKLNRVTVSQGTSLTLGQGTDVVDVESSTFNGTFGLQTSLGNDSVSIQAGAGTTVFQQGVNVNLGAGNDTLNLATGGLVRLFGSSTFDGGSGINTLNKNDANIFAVFPPVFKNF